MTNTKYTGNFGWEIYWKETTRTPKNKENNFKINLTGTKCTRLELHVYKIGSSSTIKWLRNIEIDKEDGIPKREFLYTGRF
jgi:hypothetical protein